MIIEKQEVDFETVGCIITFNKKYLLFHRSKENLWNSVAGKVEENEDAKTAINREIFEEMGIKIIPQFFVKTYHKYGDKKVSYNLFTFNFEKDPSDKINLDKEHDKYGFFDIEEALNLNLYEDEDYCLKLHNERSLNGT